MSMLEAPPLWEDLSTGSAHDPPMGRRLHSDGRYFEYGDRKAHFDPRSSRMIYEPLPLDWHLVRTLPLERIARVEALLREAGALQLPACFPLAGQAADTGTWTIHIRLDGETRQIRVEGYPLNDPPALLHLLDGLSRIVGEV
jgi:hypothetical protein